MKEIELTRGKVAKVDDADYEWLNQWKWLAAFDGHNYYAVRTVGWRKGEKKTIKMHREILKLSDPKIHGEHIDGDGLNNQRANLRPATYSQNRMNCGIHKNSKTGIKGVFIQNGVYVAQITADGKQKYLGSFKDIEEAISVRQEAEKIYHKEFARRNICA